MIESNEMPQEDEEFYEDRRQARNAARGQHRLDEFEAAGDDE